MKEICEVKQGLELRWVHGVSVHSHSFSGLRERRYGAGQEMPWQGLRSLFNLATGVLSDLLVHVGFAYRSALTTSFGHLSLPFHLRLSMTFL
jgi:hypothetical protein